MCKQPQESSAPRKHSTTMSFTQQKWIFVDERYVDEKLAVFDRPPEPSRVQQFLRTCMDTVDDTCVRLCSRTVFEDIDCRHYDSSMHHPSGMSPQSSVQQLESLQIYPSNEDVQEFASRGGFYDGTFPLDDEDLWNVVKEQEFHEKILSPHFTPPPACPPKTRAAHRSEATWWCSKKSLQSRRGINNTL